MIILKIATVLAFSVMASSQIQKSSPNCDGIACPANFRCQDGRCLKQQKKAKKTLCVKPEYLGKIQAIRCTTRSYACPSSLNIPSCGFANNGNKADFSDDCRPCLDTNIDYYYRLPCSIAPISCNQNQQCINGKCIEILNSAGDINRKICNSNSDCKPIVELCVANKCVKKQSLISILSKDKQSYK